MASDPSSLAAAETPVVSAAPDPDWPRHFAAYLAHEARLYLRMVADATSRPKRFAVDWSTGTLRLLNPASFFGISMSILTVVERVLPPSWSGAPEGGGGSFARTLGIVLAPYAYFLALAVFCHFMLRPFASPRRLRTSVGLALLAGGGPTLLVWLVLFVPIALVLRPWMPTVPRATGMTAAVLLGVVRVASFAIPYSSMAAGLYGVRRRLPLAILFGAVAALAFVLGALGVDSYPGIPQPVIQLELHLKSVSVS